MSLLHELQIDNVLILGLAVSVNHPEPEQLPDVGISVDLRCST